MELLDDGAGSERQLVAGTRRGRGWDQLITLEEVGPELAVNLVVEVEVGVFVVHIVRYFTNCSRHNFRIRLQGITRIIFNFRLSGEVCRTFEVSVLMGEEGLGLGAGVASAPPFTEKAGKVCWGRPGRRVHVQHPAS